MHRQRLQLDTKIQPQLSKQKSPAIDITSATTVQHQPTSSPTDQQTLLSKNSHYREVLMHACVHDALNLITKSNTNCSQD